MKTTYKVLKYTLAPILITFSAVFYILVVLRRSLESKRQTGFRLPGKVISVGNIYVGGTGKTPTIIEIVKYIKSKGLSVVVLSRGYRSNLSDNAFGLYEDGRLEISDNSSKKVCADESLLVSNLCDCPSLFGVDRVGAAKWYLSSNSAPDVWVLDDGFQHFKIQRDLDIVLLDFENNLNKEFVFPFGLLREPLGSLRFCDAIVFTRSKGATNRPHWFKGHSHLKDFNSSEVDLGLFEAKSYYTFKHVSVIKNPFVFVSGIADPERVLDQLKSQKLVPAQSKFYPDHVKFEKESLEVMGKSYPCVLTTDKDYARCSKLLHDCFEVVVIKRISFEFSSEFYKTLDDSIKAN